MTYHAATKLARRRHPERRTLGDAASDEFGDIIGSPSLIQAFSLADLPPFPIAIEVHSKSFFESSSSNTRVAVGWDNGAVWEGQPLDLSMGGILTIPVDTPKGAVLEVWADAGGFLPGHDDAGQIDTVLALPLSQAQQRVVARAPNQSAGPIPSWLLPAGLGLAAVATIGPLVIPFLAARPRTNPRRRRRR